jgi:hypothetical protein
MATSRGPLIRSLADALKDAPLLPRDSGAVALAKQYAAAIDADGDVLDALGPKLLAVLVQLGMTPAGRGAKGGAPDGPVASKLDELRARREQRAG